MVKEITNKDLMDFMGKMAEDITGIRQEMASGFANISTRLDFITVEIADIKERVDAIAERTKEDDTILFKEVERLKERIKKAEREIAILRSRKV